MPSRILTFNYYSIKLVLMENSKYLNRDLINYNTRERV